MCVEIQTTFVVTLLAMDVQGQISQAGIVREQ